MAPINYTRIKLYSPSIKIYCAFILVSNKTALSIHSIKCRISEKNLLYPLDFVNPRKVFIPGMKRLLLSKEQRYKDMHTSIEIGKKYEEINRKGWVQYIFLTGVVRISK